MDPKPCAASAGEWRRWRAWLIAIAVLGGAAEAEARRPPNVVVFLVDDLGWSDVGFNGSPFYETPNLDAFARSGTVFTNAYAASPVCSPTRASLLTGRHPVRLGVTDWLKGMGNHRVQDLRLLPPEDRDQMALEEVTIAEALKERRYQTYFIGKWHLGDRGYWPEDQGFDRNIGGCATGSPPAGYHAPFEIPTLRGRPDDAYLTDRLTDEAIELLRRRDSGLPFLLYFSFYNVHTPIEANDEHVGRFRAKAAALPGPTPTRREHTAVTRMRQDDPELASMVASVDVAVGRVLDALDELGCAEETVVFFTSDNGGLSTHRSMGAGCNLPLRAGKGWLYEGGIRVPLAVRAPGVSTPGSVVDTPVSSADLFPTILHLVGLPPRPALHRDGVDLTPGLRGEAIADRALYWHYPHYHGSQWAPGAAIREGRWKLVEHFHWDKVELFDLSADAGESRDLSRDEPEKTAELLAKLAAWRAEIGAAMPSANPDHRPATEAAILSKQTAGGSRDDPVGAEGR